MTDTEQEQDWVEYQQTEIDETKEEIGTRLEHIASTVHNGLLEGEKLQEHQNSRIEAYLEGYADALKYAAGRVERIDNLAKYAQEAEPPSDNSEPDTYRETALERGRPTEPCNCETCECDLHTFPDDDCCIWCRNGHHRSVEPDIDQSDGGES